MPKLTYAGNLANLKDIESALNYTFVKADICDFELLEELMKKYKIDAARITAEGQGIGDMFSEPDWNRVSICTIDESK